MATKSLTAERSVKHTKRQNPDWTHEEHILALDLYLRMRGTSYNPNTPEIVNLSMTLQKLAKIRGMSGSATFRNPDGVSMKMMNFRRVDPSYTADGGVGLKRGSNVEKIVWGKFANNPQALMAAVAEISAGLKNNVGFDVVDSLNPSSQYWIFVCNPQKWAIDRFLETHTERDSWGIRKSDAHKFAPGQLGVIRVGVDRRNATQRDGRPRLNPGIYALCEVESFAFPGTGAGDRFWASGAERDPGWPTVRIRYLRNYLSAPLTIKRLSAERPDVSPWLLNGIEASSFPISSQDFYCVMELLREDPSALAESLVDSVDTLSKLAALEAKFANANPKVKARISNFVERGSIGAAVKEANEYKCQLCEAMGSKPHGFLKRNGDPYVEAHHVMPVSKLEVGSLSSSNIMTLCANHHRQIHYGATTVKIEANRFEISFDGMTYAVPKIMLPN